MRIDLPKSLLIDSISPFAKSAVIIGAKAADSIEKTERIMNGRFVVIDNIPIADALIHQFAKSKSKPLCRISPSLQIKFQTPEETNSFIFSQSKKSFFTRNSGVSCLQSVKLANTKYTEHSIPDIPIYHRRGLKTAKRRNKERALIALEKSWRIVLMSNLFLMKVDTPKRLNMIVPAELADIKKNSHFTSVTK